MTVQALGTRWDCPPFFSQLVKGQTLDDQAFIPNTFTLNGNEKDDVFKVYSRAALITRVNLNYMIQIN
ncbi:hypothetical protein FAM09_15155 [Niastella caeni]|uniref:Uncharacterized protein n=1 Tax=Niastella caeni TaxID=2569763 RepID=A0A4S8HXQ7_9BACT|nr:hypothetical protein [Niastella caeni]THU38022.1 hypothetical protein FAM09_15155 [Niastella caeni]